MMMMIKDEIKHGNLQKKNEGMSVKKNKQTKTESIDSAKLPV